RTVVARLIRVVPRNRTAARLLAYALCGAFAFRRARGLARATACDQEHERERTAEKVRVPHASDDNARLRSTQRFATGEPRATRSVVAVRIFGCVEARSRKVALVAGTKERARGALPRALRAFRSQRRGFAARRPLPIRRA